MTIASGPGSVALAQHQLADREAEEARGGGAPADALGQASGAGIAPSVKRSPTQPVARPSARQGPDHPEDVAEQQRGERHADPEGDVDHRRREGRSARSCPRSGIDGEEEDDEAERAQEHLERHWEDEEVLLGRGFRRGRDQPSARATKETTSTAAAARRTGSRGPGGRRGRRSACAKRSTRRVRRNGPADAGPFS